MRKSRRKLYSPVVRLLLSIVLCANVVKSTAVFGMNNEENDSYLSYLFAVGDERLGSAFQGFNLALRSDEDSQSIVSLQESDHDSLRAELAAARLAVHEPCDLSVASMPSDEFSLELNVGLTAEQIHNLSRSPGSESSFPSSHGFDPLEISRSEASIIFEDEVSVAGLRRRNRCRNYALASLFLVPLIGGALGFLGWHQGLIPFGSQSSSLAPSGYPTGIPTFSPSGVPSFAPSGVPSLVPSRVPFGYTSASRVPTFYPSATENPTVYRPNIFNPHPTSAPSVMTQRPVLTPAPSFAIRPTGYPTVNTIVPSTNKPVVAPTATPIITSTPTAVPVIFRFPTEKPTHSSPTGSPTFGF